MVAGGRLRLIEHPSEYAVIMGSNGPPIYAELHAHSYFSFLDSVASPEELVQAAASLDIGTIALTDHNGLYGVPRFLQAARGLGVTPIVGAELTVGSSGTRAGVVDPVGEHLVVLAASPEGYRALSKFISKGLMDAQAKGGFAATLADLARAKPERGWVILTGCRKGPLNQAILRGGRRALEARTRELIELFGPNDLVVEVSYHFDPLDTVRMELLSETAASYGLLAAATQNVHAVDARGQAAGTVTAAIRSNRSLFDLDGHLPAGGIPRIRHPRQQRLLFKRYPGLVEATLEIASRCAFPVELVTPELPRNLAPPGFSDSKWLAKLTFERAPERYGTEGNERVPGAYRQIRYELEIIDKLGFAGYFLVVADIVDFCKREGIYCQGRGSAANSAVCYALGITNADPVDLKLLFERFLSPERDGPPDIDVDIESGRRDQVIQYVYDRYGREYAAQVASVITYRARSALRDAARVYGVPSAQIDLWSRQIERSGSLSASLAARDHRGAPLLELPKPLAEAAMAIEGSPRHLGLHVGGMVICDRPIVEVCPIEWARKAGRSAIQWDKDDCAAMGLVKFDLLGLGMLEAIHEMVDIVRNVYGTTVDIALLPQEDEVYEMLSRADTVGLFQVESRAQMATLPRLKPRHFYDLVVEVALIRPGPIQGGSVHPYLKRRSGKEEVSYLHPLLERSLAKTLGVPLFQEQLMQMAMDVAGFSPSEADSLRQAMSSKRSADRMLRLKQRLFAGMEEKGIPDGVKERIYEQLAAFANFGFPESHSASFAYIVYVSAWLKLHYPAAFYAGILRSQPMGFWSPQTLTRDAVRHGVGIRGPDVNLSEAKASVEVDGGSSWIRLGLLNIKGLGEKGAAKILEHRPYPSLEELARRTGLSEVQLEGLARSGAIDDFGHGRRDLLWLAGLATATRNAIPELLLPEDLPDLGELSPYEQLAMEIASLGLSVEGHPMQLFRPELEQLGVLPSSSLPSAGDGRRVRVAGAVTHRQRPGTAKGVVFLNLEDETGLANVLVKPGVWIRYRSEALAPAVVVSGILQYQEGVATVVAGSIKPLLEAVPLRSRDFH